ncbi:hypothetical protein E8E14_014960 [Neopestalotiopsis sp. 37M]|nr:hypothetical protein E8E14_014960 [Neopestalotiopsis sp. 37M]
MPANNNREPVVRMSTPMPDGYVFVSKGNVYMTANCRKQTQAAGQTVYAVVDKNKRGVGIRVPRPIRDTVWDSEAATRKDREAAVKKHDEALELKFRQVLKKMFPAAPEGEIPQIVARAMAKGSGRVGRTSKIDIEQKATLAVVASIRHKHTDYDKKLRTGMERTEARKQIDMQVRRMLASWRRQETSAPRKEETPAPRKKGTHAPITKPGAESKENKNKAGETGTSNAVSEADLKLQAIHRMRQKREAVKMRKIKRKEANRRRKESRRRRREAGEIPKVTPDLQSDSRRVNTQNLSKSPPSPRERKIYNLRTRHPEKISEHLVESQPSLQSKIGQSLRDDGSNIEESDEYVSSSEDNCIWISSDEDD